MTHHDGNRRFKSAFREFRPDEQIVADRVGDVIRRNFEAVGAASLRTCALELRDTLFASSSGAGLDDLIYTVNEPSEREGSAVSKLALRYDLTVPLMRWISQHVDQLTFPFRRYQIQPVWRCEEDRSNQFNEFVQCDIDVVGDGHLDLMTDAEMVAIVNNIFRELGIGRYEIRLSNRKLLEGLLLRVGLDRLVLLDAIMVIDKLNSLGLKRLRSEIHTKFGLDTEQVERIVRFLSVRGTYHQVLSQLSEVTEGLPENPRFDQGAEEIRIVANGATLMGVPAASFLVDLSVARSFAYYTGSVIETMLIDHPGLGSVCSGGRYDELANLVWDRKLPGVGISIGLTSLVSRLLQAGVLKVGTSTTASVLVTSRCRDALPRYLDIGARLRKAGIGAEIYLEDHDISHQLSYAKAKGFGFALVADDAHLDARTWRIKNLSTGQTVTVSDADVESSVVRHEQRD